MTQQIEPRLTAEEVGSVEYYRIMQAIERFGAKESAAWFAERYGRMCIDKLHLIRQDMLNGRVSNRTDNAALDAYNFARLAHNGWRALRGL